MGLVKQERISDAFKSGSDIQKIKGNRLRWDIPPCRLPFRTELRPKVCVYTSIHTNSMETFLKDLKHSARMFWQNRGFTAAAVAALALGIGLNTAIFSVVNTVLLKPAPFPDPDRLVLFQNTSPQGSGGAASPAKFQHWRE